MKKTFIFFTCEHASNAIPHKYKKLFLGKQILLASHRGYDIGTKLLGKKLGKSFKAPVIYGKYSRLLIDLNRSSNHRNAFSEMSKRLPLKEQREIIANYHSPHWDEVKKLIDKKIADGFFVLHIGVHSFTPILHKSTRNADIGILYDSRRKRELKFSRGLQKSLCTHTSLRIRRNYPYLGKLDGLTSKLRASYSENKYLGLEIEINQAMFVKADNIKLLNSALRKSLLENISI